ncbi:AAA family ATPase [Nakamurella sp.]|uniref:AAA family ATPase n=1 Tax=Nakamurella sp. TaxID=1869182 RepID=UPI003B3ADA6B
MTKSYWTAAELLSTTLPVAKWAVSGVIAEGVTLLAGPPKVGKSWLALNLAVDIAGDTGSALGGIDILQGDVLYLALEDTARRLQGRLRKVLGVQPAPHRLHISTEWPGLQQGGADRLDRWLTDHPGARLVVVDVLAKIRGLSSSNGNQYAEDYAVMNQLKVVADKHGVAILVVTHVRKMASADFLEQVSGTNGIAGAADCTIVLSRTRGELHGELDITGRDVEETKYAMVWRPDAGRWDLDGNGLAEAQAAAHRAQITTGLSDRSTEIVEFIGKHPDGVKAKAVAEHIGIDQDKVRPYLQRLEKSGRILKPSTGLYTPVTGVTTVTADVTDATPIEDFVDPETGTTVVSIEWVERDAVTPVTDVTGVQGGCPICSTPLVFAAVPTARGPACRRCAPGIKAGTTCADCGHPRDLVKDGRCNPCQGRASRAAS